MIVFDFNLFTGFLHLPFFWTYSSLLSDVQKVKRGYYTVEMKLMTAHAKQTAENEITESYARMTEKMILRNPAYWLWTHKRWKYKREDA